MRTELYNIMTVAAMVASAGFVACTNNIDRPTEVSANTISEQLAAVRDYVPLYAVIAHRGSTYWAPEETESAWRWAREMGADYLESDMQCSTAAPTTTRRHQRACRMPSRH